MNNKLIKEFYEKVDELVDSLKHLKFNINNYDSKASTKIANILKKDGYKAIGGGSYRAVYSREDVPFVIKVGFSAEGMLSNKREVLAASSHNKSQNIKSILPHLYHHDKNFAWVIFEKVIPISRYVKDIDKEYNVIAKVFPTFHRIFSRSNAYHHKPKSERLYLITDLISQTFYYIVKDRVKDYNLIINKIKEQYPSSGTIQDWNKDIENIISEEPMEDIKMFIKSSSIDNTLDIPSNNLGRRYSDNPSPKDIVILDFDDSPQYSKNVLPVKNKKDAEIINTNVDDYRKSKVKANDLYDDFDYWEPSEEDYYDNDDDDIGYPIPYEEYKNENITKNIYLSLLKESFYKEEQDIAFKLKEMESNPESWSVYNDLYSVLEKDGYEIIGSGHSRVVFSKKDVPFVVKLASRNTGIAANKSEISFSSDSNLKNSSNQVSDILPQLYTYSTNEDPMWIICEKVIPIKEASIDMLKKTFPTLHYFASKKTLNDGSVVERNLTKDEFSSLIQIIIHKTSLMNDASVKKVLSLIKRECDLRYAEDYDLVFILNNMPLLDIKRFISSTSYDYTLDLNIGNLGIRNQKNISPNSFVILDFDPNISSYKGKDKVRHFFDKNPDHPSHPRHDAKLVEVSIYKSLIMELLNQSDRKEQESIKTQLLYKRSIDDVINVLIDSGYSPIGEGSFRKVYSKSDVNFVIKVAKNEKGIESNSKEITVSHPDTKSIGVKQILPNLYEFDRRYDPIWIICEKVKPIRLASYEEIIKVFPTFFKAFENHYWFDKTPEESKKKKLIDVIEDTYLYIVRNNVSDKLKIIDEILIHFTVPGGLNKKIINSESLLDIDHFINSTSYDYTSDLYLRNLAIRNSGNPSPEDFVILDFDTQFQRKKSSSYHDPGFISFSSDDDMSSDDMSSYGYSNESVAEAVYKRLMIESLKQKRKYSGSHPDETYRYGWPEFDDAWFDADGKTTWDEDREWTKQYLKSIGLL